MVLAVIPGDEQAEATRSSRWRAVRRAAPWVALPAVFAAWLWFGNLRPAYQEARRLRAAAQERAATPASAAADPAREEAQRGLDAGSITVTNLVIALHERQYGAAYDQMAAVYRAAVTPALFRAACESHPILSRVKDVTVFQVRGRTAPGSPAGPDTITVTALLRSEGGNAEAVFHLTREPDGPRVVSLTVAGVPALQPVTPAPVAPSSAGKPRRKRTPAGHPRPDSAR